MTPSCGAAITRAFTKTMNTCGRLISVSDCSTNIIITQIYYSMTYNMHCKVSIVTLEELDTVSVVQQNHSLAYRIAKIVTSDRLPVSVTGGQCLTTHPGMMLLTVTDDL